MTCIAKQDLPFSGKTRSGKAEYPAATCPICTTSVRACFDAERITARQRVCTQQPLVEGRPAVFFPYFDLCQGNLLCFFRWPMHYRPYDDDYAHDEEDNAHVEADARKDDEDYAHKQCGRERMDRKHKYQHKQERWKGLVSGNGAFEEEDQQFHEGQVWEATSGAEGKRRVENKKQVAQLRKHDQAAALKQPGRHRQRADRQNSANLAGKEASSSRKGGYLGGF